MHFIELSERASHRMKLKKGDYYVEEPIPLHHIFGDDWWFYILPTPPLFSRRCEVLGYSIAPEEISSGSSGEEP